MSDLHEKKTREVGGRDRLPDSAPVKSGSDDFFADMPIVYTYSREQAIADGVLIDLTKWASVTSFRCPVAITAAAWVKTIAVSPAAAEWGQSERGRAHDVLFMLFCAIRLGGTDQSVLLYKVSVSDGPDQREIVTLKAIAGPGDHGELVMTIMLPDED